MAANRITVSEQVANLQQRQIDAYHLGLKLKEMVRKEETAFSHAADLAATFLLSWTELVEAIIREHDKGRFLSGGGTPQKPGR